MEDNQNTNNPTVDNGGQEKTFTQAELDKIVQERVGRERAKYDGFEDLKAKAEKYDALEEANKSELQKAQERTAELEAQIKKMTHEKEVQAVRTKVATEKGIPAELLTGETEEACISQADKILTFAQSNGYPAVKDSGEVGKTGKATARDQFDQWAKKVL